MLNNENSIEVRNVSKSFKVYFDKGNELKEKMLFWKRNRYENRVVLNNISFTVKKGEAVGLIGRNGCGKSTTLKLLTKIIYPDSGSIEMCGRVSSLLELGAGFHPDMSGRENIYTNAAIFGLTKKEIDERLEDIIEFSSSDKRYAENKRNMPHFLYSVILWGVFQNNVFRLRRYSESMVSPMEDNDIVRLALDSVFDNQDKVTGIPMAVSDSIKSLWRMQLVLQQIELLKDYDEVSNRTIFRAAFDFISLRTKFEPYLATCVNFWQPYYVKSAAIAAKRKALKDQKYQQKFSNKKKSKKQKGAKNPATEGFEDETNLSAKRKEQLAKARAWRASMNLGN